MRASATAIILAVCISLGVAVEAQNTPTTPGTRDTGKVSAGTYMVDASHTQVLFAFDHLGFSNNFGLFARPSGSLTLDPAKPEGASVEIVFPVKHVATGVPDFDEHLLSADFFEADKYPTASFKSTSVKVDGMEAEITGDLTIKGITKEVTLDASFTGAGTNPMLKKETVGFSADVIIKRSEFGLGKYVPLVGDAIELKITAAFEK